MSCAFHGGLGGILEAGIAPGFRRPRTPWRSFVSAMQDDPREASKIYAADPEGVNRSKPNKIDLHHEN